MALLFRASTTFPVYEQALEESGIPFVTVAGSGFYDRPEVRDLLNLLRALADPWDDQALAGLLRSPALGVSDAGLYWLRKPEPVQKALYAECPAAAISIVSHPPIRERARRALEILEELAPWVDRLPVAELLQRLVDRTGYRAALAAAQIHGQGQRAASLAQRGQADQRRPGQRAGAGAGFPGMHRHPAGCWRPRR